MNFVFKGFAQEEGVRRFHFECHLASPNQFAAARRTVQFEVSADMSLFLRYGIPIQDGPSICRDVLASAVARFSESELVSTTYTVMEAHIGAIAAARVAEAEAKSSRRHRRPTPVK